MSITAKTDYGEIPHATILQIFGDELSYNELKSYATDMNKTLHLEVESTVDELWDFIMVRVWFNSVKVMDNKYKKYHSCDMFFHLNELEIKLDSN